MIIFQIIMPPKRGRPTLETENVDLRQRRAQDAARRRNFYHRQRMERMEQARQAAALQPTPAQLQQEEKIVNFSFDEWDTTPTMAQLQLRVQGLTLAQDHNDPRQQQDAIPINEHETLYADNKLTSVQGPSQSISNPSFYHQNTVQSSLQSSNSHPNLPPIDHSSSNNSRPNVADFFRPRVNERRSNTSTPPPPQSKNTRSGQSNISHFFHSLPARNPFDPNILKHTPDRANTSITARTFPTNNNDGDLQDDSTDLTSNLFHRDTFNNFKDQMSNKNETHEENRSGNEHEEYNFGSEHEDLNAEHEDLNTEHEDSSAEHEDLNTEHEDSSTEHEDPNTEHEDLNTEHEELNTEHEDLNTEHEDSSTEHEDPNTEHEDLNTEHEDPNTEHEDLNTEHEEDSQHEKNSIDSKQAENNDDSEQEENTTSGNEQEENNDDSQQEENNTSGNEQEENNEDSENNEVSALDHTVQKLYQQFQLGHNGCSSAQHLEQLQQHMNAVGNDHYDLNSLFNDPNFPSVLMLPDFISADRLSRQASPTPAQWQAMFCGVPSQQQSAHRRPMHVCLHAEETETIETDVAFDIDSFLGFFRSLAAIRHGLLYQPAPIMRQNMTTDVHIQTKVHEAQEDPELPSRSRLAMLKDVPHFLLGRIVGAENVTVHILFPHLPLTQEKFVSLSKEQITRWVDDIFHPAIYRSCRAHYTQHLPATYRNALANSRAHQVERRLIETVSYQTQQSITHVLQPVYLERIWTDVLHTIQHTPGYRDFREPELFFSAKGTKLLFKTNPSQLTLLDAMMNFQSYFERIIDPDFVFLDRFYVDLGKEICPYLAFIPSQQNGPEHEAQVYLWKRCCLERYVHEMYDGKPPARGGPGQRYYDQNMLHDACSLTSVTPKQSRLREGGLIYSQFYGSVKELSDALKCIPFDNDGLEELALDPQIRQGAHHLARGHRRDIKIVERAYLASKQRSRDVLRDKRRQSYGIREEHRISWRLFQALLVRLREVGPEDGEILMPECPPYAWAIKAEVYLNFLWRSADKFATGFEVVRAHCHQNLTTWEQTKMMAMFLRCLRFVFGGHQLAQESALWWSRRERPTRVWYGLGFCNTLPRYKYCWLEPRLDWSQLTFHEDITDRVLFGNAMLRGQYLRRGGQVQDFFNTTRRLELALDWMRRHHRNTRIRDQLIFWMVHICLQQLRIDVLNTVRTEISPNHREEALQGTQPFSYDYLHEIMTEGVYLMSGNRCDFKEVSHLVRFLLNYDDGRRRAHWEDRPFRKLYRRARTALNLCNHESRLGSTFSRRLQRHLVMHHWILPYPFSDGLMQTTKEGRRMWYSIQPKATASGPLDHLPPDAWQWARKSWRPGNPPAIHQCISWSKEEWEDWIQRHEA
jgi:hypothetical protein